jgi:hypothetical protein
VRCDYAHDDGAYVLGALAPAERSAYERHLGTCSACREAVAEIAVLPGLLGRLDSATALQLLASDGPQNGADPQPWPVMNRGDGGDARVVSLVDKAAQVRRRDRRGRRLRYASAALAAACVALVVVFGAGALPGSPPGGTPTPGPELALPMATMSPVGDPVPVVARLGLAARSWGTEVTMDCWYEKTGHDYTKAWRLQLVAIGPDNETEQVGSWVAAPGKHVQFKGATRFAGDELVRLELTRADGSAMLAYDVS